MKTNDLTYKERDLTEWNIQQAQNTKAQEIANGLAEIRKLEAEIFHLAERIGKRDGQDIQALENELYAKLEGFEGMKYKTRQVLKKQMIWFNNPNKFI